MLVTDVFDEHAIYYVKDRITNLVYLQTMLDYVRDLYRALGQLSLNEVRKAIGLPTTGAGEILGWRMPNDPVPILHLNEDIVIGDDLAAIEIAYDVKPIARRYYDETGVEHIYDP